MGRLLCWLDACVGLRDFDRHVGWLLQVCYGLVAVDRLLWVSCYVNQLL